MLRLIWPLLWGIVLGCQGAAAQDIRLSEADHRTYREAYRQFEAKQYQSARELAAKAANPLPAKVLHWRWLIRKSTEVGYAEVADFVRKNPQWPRQETLRRRAEKLMPADLPDAELLDWFEARPPVTVDGALRFAAALKRDSQLVRALDLLREVWIEFDFTLAQERSFYKDHKAILGREDNIARLDRLLWKRQAKAARRQAKRIGPDYVALAEARLRLAFRRKGVDRAVRRVPGELREDPGFVYDRARWRRRKGRHDGVVELLDKPREDLPYPKFWWPLRDWAARKALDKKDYPTAYRIASYHGFNDGLGFAEGEWMAGWIALTFLKDAKLAYQHFTRMYDSVSTPVSRARGAYWAGEAAQAKGSTKWAKHWYRLAAVHTTTYYGQLAAGRLGQDPAIELPVARAPNETERQAFARRELVRVVRLLGELDQGGVQKLFLIRLRHLAKTAVEFQLTADLALEQGRQDLALRAAKQARREDIILPDQLYPRPELPYTKGLEQELLLSLIRQESEFYSQAVSRAGARGLMQLMPATAKTLSKRLKIRYRRSKLTRDPAYNVRLGTTYLRQLLKKYRGSEALALAAYNAGPRRADRWIKRFGDPRKGEVELVHWVERIPFSETRNYIQRILEAVPVYRVRLEAHLPPPPFDHSSAELPPSNS